MKLSTHAILEQLHEPPYSLRADLFGITKECPELPFGGELSLRSQLRAFVLEPLGGGFNRRTATILADFSRQAYRERPVDSDFPFGALHRPFSNSGCSFFERAHSRVLSADGVQLLIVKNGYGEIVAAFRGTEPARHLDGDWLRDIDVALARYNRAGDLGGGNAKLHNGFFKGYRKIENKLGVFLERLVAPPARLYFTGHSQGGALAAIAALDTVVKMKHGDYLEVPVAMYSFGAPRAMSLACVEALYSKLVPESYSVLIERDPVGKMPPLSRRPIEGPSGYSHLPNVVLMNDQVLPPSQDVTITFRYGPEYQPSPVGLSGALRDQDSHSLSRYRNLLRRDEFLREREGK